ncbi:hypothetical protein Q31b_15380 [Novipirellula aureliae]|uniref:FAD-binding domain-containing protein n=1 Tax=Novipirellula aureliae TaxID=2527966 RepID=A0A5C6E2Y1_9BACT|nr:NAD(P)/FAD-dependent oxidoreductase [Novipirellula aureliae]TWU44003.1 hypothetical protein Q31b_15380 [Novipirellula aureliae]
MTILIIGGGVAGCSLAIRLRQLGIDVDLAEKEVFPRPKVCGCCIGVAGLASLRSLGVLDAARSVSMATNQWCASIGNRLLEIDLPDGIAISREVLDPLLLSAAQVGGTNIFTPCAATVTSVRQDQVEVKMVRDGKARRAEYDCVIVASGLRSGGIQETLPWTETPHGPFGISFTADSEAIQPQRIYMACDDDGYVGLVRLGDGRVDVAAALQSGGTSASKGDPLTRVKAILSRSQFARLDLVNLSPALTTPPLRRTRKAGCGRLLAVGDAAGYVEPFTGEGMTWAMQTSIAAADLIADAPGDLQSIGDRWNEKQATLLARKKRNCRWVTSALRSPLARTFAARTLTMFPALARPLIKSLN